MSLRDRILPDRSSDTEQLAEAQEVDLEPRGQDRKAEGNKFFTYFSSDRDEREYTRRAGVDTDVTIAPEHLENRYHQYVRTVPLVFAPFNVFSKAVTEPGWTVSAEIDGETDEDMEEALEMWGKNCVIYAQEPGHDILKLAKDIPEKRRGKGTMFIEKVSGPDTDLAALMPLKPSTMATFSRENQPILVQPDDDVAPDHPRKDDGTPAAYVQYHNENDRWADEEQVEFAADDIIKITFNAREGSAWGTPLWVIIREHVDGLYQKLRDRNASIRINGHPWRVIQNDSWNQTQAQNFLKAHFDGDLSTWLSDLIPGGGRSKRGPKDKKDRENTFAGRVDAIPHNIEVDEYSGDVPEIDSAIKDEVENIFSVMPVSKYQIAYEEDINQFVVEPQSEKDERNVVEERGLIREYLEPVFQEKADELASGDEYEGEVTWKLEQPDDENPLERESFNAEEFSEFVDSMTTAGAPLEFAYWAAGVDREEFEEQYEVDPLEIDESDPQAQEQFEEQQEPPGDEPDEEEDE